MKNEAAIASVFMSGRSQAVRIPKAFRLDAEKVEIVKQGKDLLLKPVKKEEPWAGMRKVAGTFPADCFDIDKPPMWGYPRMEFDEKPEHFEARVREYENWRKVEEQKEKVANREK